MKLMPKKAFALLCSLAIITALSSGVVSANAEDQGREQNNSQNSDKSKNSELASTYDSRYWGTPTKEIKNSRDQEEYDRAQQGIPGIEVAHSEVFGAFQGRQGASLVPLGSGDLIDHGGPVLSEVHVYPIFWGPTSTTFSTSYQSSISSFFQAIECGSGTSTPTCGGHADLAKQYFRSAPAAIKFGRAFTDTSAPPKSSPSTSSIVAEAAKVIKASGSSIDPLGLYMVFTSNFPARTGYCAWHSAGSYKATTKSVATWFAVAYMPFVGTTAGCSAANLPGYIAKTSPAVDSVINVTTHELFEAMTDSLLRNQSAWYDSAGYENGDKCAWNFGSTMNGYRVQSEYDNVKHGCPDLQ
jgi:hypothetical protein